MAATVARGGPGHERLETVDGNEDDGAVREVGSGRVMAHPPTATDEDDEDATTAPPPAPAAVGKRGARDNGNSQATDLDAGVTNVLDALEADMLGEAGEAVPPSRDPGVAVHMRNVTKTYLLGIEGVPALRGVSTTIRRGEFVAILGKSGGGKTSMLNIMGTIDKPTRGDLYLCGHRVDAKTPDSVLADVRLRQLGFVFQTFNLLPNLTALENVELPMVLAGVGTAASRRKRAIRLLSRVGLSERLHHMPSMMSGGEQQRTTIARALSNRPSILLLDEPTGDLDGNNSQIVLKLITDLNRLEGVTCIMVTHDVALKAFAHRVLHMVDGKVARVEEIPAYVRQDALEALATSPPVMAMVAMERQKRREAMAMRSAMVAGGGGAAIFAGGGGGGEGDEEDARDGRFFSDEEEEEGDGGPRHTVGRRHGDDVSDATLAGVNAGAARRGLGGGATAAGVTGTPSTAPAAGGGWLSSLWASMVGTPAATPCPSPAGNGVAVNPLHRPTPAHSDTTTGSSSRALMSAASSSSLRAGDLSALTHAAARSYPPATHSPPSSAASHMGLGGVAAISHALFSHGDGVAAPGPTSAPATGDDTTAQPRSIIRQPSAYATYRYELQQREQRAREAERRRAVVAAREEAMRAAVAANHAARLQRLAAQPPPPSGPPAADARATLPVGSLPLSLPANSVVKVVRIPPEHAAEAAAIMAALPQALSNGHPPPVTAAPGTTTPPAVTGAINSDGVGVDGMVTRLSTMGMVETITMGSTGMSPNPPPPTAVENAVRGVMAAVTSPSRRAPHATGEDGGEGEVDEGEGAGEGAHLV